MSQENDATKKRDKGRPLLAGAPVELQFDDAEDSEGAGIDLDALKAGGEEGPFDDPAAK